MRFLWVDAFPGRGTGRAVAFVVSLADGTGRVAALVAVAVSLVRGTGHAAVLEDIKRRPKMTVA